MADSGGAKLAPKTEVVVPLTTAERIAVLDAIAQLDGKATQKKLRRAAESLLGAPEGSLDAKKAAVKELFCQLDLNRLLHDAAEAGDVVRLRAWIAAGADVNAVLDRPAIGDHTLKMTPICSAVREDKVKENRAEEGRTACVRALLAAGASVSAAGVFYQDEVELAYIALHSAAFVGLTTCCRLLLDAGAEVNAPDNNDSTTPLQYAAEDNHHRTVVLLLSRGATIDGCTGDLENYSPGYHSRISSAGGFANYQKQQRAKLMAMLAPKFSHLLPPELVSHVITFWGHLGWK